MHVTHLLLLFAFFSPFTSSPFLSAAITPIADENQLEILSPKLQNIVTTKVVLSSGIEVLITSDPLANQSAASLSVAVGSWQDPPEYPGTAHFVEHLLFMGNEVYPEEDALLRHASLHGGVVNAYTSTDRTVYTVSCDHEGFVNALDQLAAFVSSPLFDEEKVDRELTAVDQEHGQYTQSDPRRAWMILKEIANPHHPHHQFSTGNRESLSHIPLSTVREWFTSHYTPNKMHLAVYTTLPSERAVELVETCFAKIEKKGGVPPRQFPSSSPVKQDSSPYQSTAHQSSTHMSMGRTRDRAEEIFHSTGQLLYIPPLQEKKELSLIWEIPRSGGERSADLLAYAINKSNLADYLKEHRLATGLFASTMHLSKEKALFTIDVDLTEKGCEQYEEVTAQVFAFLNLAKKTPYPFHLYDELQKMTHLGYAFQQRQNPYHFVSKQAHQMIDEPLSTFPEKSLVYPPFSPEKIALLALSLSPEKGILLLSIPPHLTPLAANQSEPWTGAPYALSPLPTKQMELYKKRRNNALTFPEETHYLPGEIPLLYQKGEESPSPPHLAVDKSRGQLYLFPDRFYLSPKVIFAAKMKSPSIDGSCRGGVLLDLYTSILNIKLEPLMKEVRRGGGLLSLSPKDDGLLLSCQGYPSAALAAWAPFVEKIKRIPFDAHTFEIVKKELASFYHNQSRELAYQIALQKARELCHTPHHPAQEKLEELSTITFKELGTFRNHLFGKIYIEAIAGGNISETQAKQFWKTLLRFHRAPPYPQKEHLKKRTALLSSDEGVLLPLSCALHGDATLLQFQLGKRSPRTAALQLLFEQVASDRFFSELRTEQQTGYLAKAWGSLENDHLFFNLLVQSTTHHPVDLLHRFTRFSNQLLDKIDEKLPQDNFITVKKALVAKYRRHPDTLEEHINHLYHGAYSHSGDFERRARLAKEITAIDYETFCTEVKELFRKSPRMAITVYGSGGQNALPYKETSEERLLQMLDTGSSTTKESVVANN